MSVELPISPSSGIDTCFPPRKPPALFRGSRSSSPPAPSAPRWTHSRPGPGQSEHPAFLALVIGSQMAGSQCRPIRIFQGLFFFFFNARTTAKKWSLLNEVIKLKGYEARPASSHAAHLAARPYN